MKKAVLIDWIEKEEVGQKRRNDHKNLAITWRGIDILDVDIDIVWTEREKTLDLLPSPITFLSLQGE